MKNEKINQILSVVCGYPCRSNIPGGEPECVDVFNCPKENKRHVENLIHEALDVLEELTGDNMFAAVVVVTMEETKQYYPEKVGLAVPKVSEEIKQFADLVREIAQRRLK